jgi:ligand-binding sensor domain-containing protein
VATGGGLAIVAGDGTVRALTALDGLPETRIRAVAEQGAGLWVGTEAGGAFVSLSGAEPAVTRRVVDAPVQAVHVAAGGKVYLGTRGAGVFELSSLDADPHAVSSAASGASVEGMTDDGGTLYVAYSDGPVARLERGRLEDVPGGPTHGQSLAVVRGRVIVGDLEGLFEIDGHGTRRVASFDTRGLASTGAKLLAATYGDGLRIGDLPVAPGSTSAVFRGEAGVAALARGVGVRGTSRCVATDEGVFFDADGSGFHKVVLGGPPSNDVTAVAASDDGRRIAVGTFDRGAALYASGAFRGIDGIDPHEAVNSLAWQGDRLWIATIRGLVLVAADGRVRRYSTRDGLPSPVVRALHVLAGGRLLVGTDAGPALVDGERVTPLAPLRKGGSQSLASPMHATWALASGADGTLYIGTNTGLYVGREGRYVRASLAGGDLEDDWVTALAVEGADVFVGTYSKGVTRLRLRENAREARPLGGGHVNPGGLVLSNGKIYAATMEGLLVRPDDDDAARWMARPDASPGRDVTAVRFTGAEAWVASRRGLAVAPRSLL